MAKADVRQDGHTRERAASLQAPADDGEIGNSAPATSSRADSPSTSALSPLSPPPAHEEPQGGRLCGRPNQDGPDNAQSELAGSQRPLTGIIRPAKARLSGDHQSARQADRKRQTPMKERKSNENNTGADCNGVSCLRYFRDSVLGGPFKRKFGQSVANANANAASSYKTSKKYRQNLANYAAQRDKYRQKQEIGQLKTSARGARSSLANLQQQSNSSKVASVSSLNNRQGGASNANAQPLPLTRDLATSTSNCSQQIPNELTGPLSAKKWHHLIAKPKPKPTVQLRATSYSVGPRSSSLSGARWQPAADGSLQANQHQHQHQQQHHHQQQQQQQSTNNTGNNSNNNYNNTSMHQHHWSHTRFCKLIESRKKAAKMLIVIVIMFGLCYLPVHFLNTLR